MRAYAIINMEAMVDYPFEMYTATEKIIIVFKSEAARGFEKRFAICGIRKNR
jgi:hypothetical protein